MQLDSIQQALCEAGLDGWLFYDFHHRDPVSYRVLGLDMSKMTTRRWYYFVPATGEPRKLCHTVEPRRLDGLPGEKMLYLPWQQMHSLLRDLLGGARRVAMQYSPLCNLPYISTVDAGTVELVRSFGVEPVSSADLVQRFEAYVGPEAFATHLEAGRRMHDIAERAFAEIGHRVASGERATELEMVEFMLGLYRQHGLVWDCGPPIVAVGAHAGDPHFEPTPENTSLLSPGDRVLIDLWARLDAPHSIYFDITWMGYIGGQPPADYLRVFEIVRGARDRAVELLEQRFAEGRPVAGWEVDRVARGHIEAAGYGSHFVHRTGHCIGEEVHGNGANIDNLETKDERRLVPGSLFSIEPGIYLPEFGVRSEIDVYITPQGRVQVTGPRQDEIVHILP